jgi:hypothetical protein
MKRKLLLTAAIIISSVVLLNAQPPCDTSYFPKPGVYPDSAQNLPLGYVNYVYDAVINAKVPVDTVYLGATIPFDSVGVTNITGLPTGFSYATNTASGYWHGGHTGCAAIKCPAPGPTEAQVGTWPLTVYVNAHLGGFLNMPETLTYYHIIIKDSVTGIASYDKSRFTLFQNSPNPFASTTTIQFSSPQSDVFNFIVYDVIGNIVYNQSVKANSGINDFVFSSENLSSGIYFYKLGNDKVSYTRRMIVANK